MTAEEVWFSHLEQRWEAGDSGFSWTGEKKIWDWDHCTVGIARTLEDKLLVVVRSKTNKNSRYMGDKPVELRFMLGFEASSVSEPESEVYTARENHPGTRTIEGPRERWVFHLKGTDPGDDYWIWEWAEEEGEITSSSTYQLYQLISEEISSPSKESDNVFDAQLRSQDERLIPVLYQPAVDSLDNFVREVHLAKKQVAADGGYEVEVSIIFNNEDLRRHAYGGIGNKIYEVLRYLLLGRTLDIETFKVLVREDAADNKYVFESVYSGDHQLENDSIHGDPPPAPERIIKYYFVGPNHPVVFINTSNHAMAEHDTNHRIWKWEYVPWADNAPIKLGDKTREVIEKEFKPKLKFW